MSTKHLPSLAYSPLSHLQIMKSLLVLLKLVICDTGMQVGVCPTACSYYEARY